MQPITLVSWILRGVLLIVCSSFIGISIVLVITEYQVFTHTLLRSLGKLHRINEFQQQYLMPSKFTILRIATFAAAVVTVGLTVVVWKKIPYLVSGLLEVFQLFRQKLESGIRGFSVAERRLIMLLWFIISAVNLYNCIQLPISYDEAWTYLNLSSKNLFVSASYYPAPNNHILFTLFTNITTWLPVDPKIAIRIPNLVIASGAFFIILLILKDIFYPALAILLTILFYSFYPVVLYSMQARGYFLYMLFTLLIFYFFYHNRYQGRSIYWTFFGIAAALGFYTIPSFLYAFVTVFSIAALFFLIRKNSAALKALILTSSLAAIIVVVLYTPVFMVSGIGAITNNSYTKPKPFHDIISLIPEHLMQTASWYLGNISGYTHIIICLLLLVSLILSLVKKEKRLLAVSIGIAFLCPATFMLLHRTIPFERTWSYTLFFLLLCIGLLISMLLSPRIIRNGLYFFCAAILTLGFALFYTKYPQNYAVDYDSKKLADYLLASNCHKMYIQSDYQEVLLYYYYTINQETYSIDNGFTGAALDTSKEYDCLIMRKDAASPLKVVKYYPAEVSKFITLYLRDK